MKLDISNSTNISEIEYFPDTEKMIVTFKNNSKYEYESIPQHIIEELKNSQSVGSYFQTRIRNVYKGSKVE